MSAKKKCEICLENDNKYKCPHCLILYCSLGCYKIHKESCQSMPKSSQDKTISNLPNESLTISSIVEKIQETANKSGAEFINKIVQPEKNDLELNDTSSDLIPEERLRILSDSDKLKGLLANKHLKNLMVDLNQHDGNMENKMEKLMQEPLFQEFSETCLTLIQKQ